MLILPTRAMNNYCQYQSQRIDGQVPLPPGDFLSSIVTPFFSTLSSANRLAIDNCDRGSRFLTARLSYFLSQFVVDLLPSAVIPPFPNYSVNRAPVRKILRQHTPLAPRADYIQNRVDDQTPFKGPPPTSRTFRKQLAKVVAMPHADWGITLYQRIAIAKYLQKRRTELLENVG